MSTLLATAVVLAGSGAAYALGIAATVARLVPAMVAKGWTPPAASTPTKDENPFRGNGGAR